MATFKGQFSSKKYLHDILMRNTQQYADKNPEIKHKLDQLKSLDEDFSRMKLKDMLSDIESVASKHGHNLFAT